MLNWRLQYIRLSVSNILHDKLVRPLISNMVSGALFGNTSGVRGIHRLFASMATLRTSSRSPLGSERDHKDGEVDSSAATSQQNADDILPEHKDELGQLIVESDEDEDEMELNKAIQMNLETNNRYTTNGTDLVEMQRALALSLLESGYEPPYMEDDEEEEEDEQEEQEI